MKFKLHDRVTYDESFHPALFTEREEHLINREGVIVSIPDDPDNIGYYVVDFGDRHTHCQEQILKLVEPALPF